MFLELIMHCTFYKKEKLIHKLKNKRAALVCSEADEMSPGSSRNEREKKERRERDFESDFEVR